MICINCKASLLSIKNKTKICRRNPECKRLNKAANAKKFYSNPDKKAHHRKHISKKYREDPEYRAKSNTYAREFQSKNRKLYNNYYYKWLEKHPEARAIKNVRCRVSHVLRGRVKIDSSIGCSQEELKKHIESQFQPGMNWDNYGEWHIDHKFPLSVAYELGPDKFAEACNYKNLQPLWRPDNISKGNKV